MERLNRMGCYTLIAWVACSAAFGTYEAYNRASRYVSGQLDTFARERMANMPKVPQTDDEQLEAVAQTPMSEKQVAAAIPAHLKVPLPVKSPRGAQ